MSPKMMILQGVRNPILHHVACPTAVWACVIISAPLPLMQRRLPQGFAWLHGPFEGGC